MDGKAAVEWILNLERFGSKPGLERMKWLLARLGNPEQAIPAVHVAGTNGKGSTCHILSEMLTRHGYRVGLFTSPFVYDFCERITINNHAINLEWIGRITDQIKPLAEKAEQSSLKHPTQFEVITVLAFCYFRYQKPDLAILETGLGGRLDATNVIDPEISIITSIGYDHIGVLGETLEEIAREKAGIIKKNRPVIIGFSPNAEGFEEIARRASYCDAPLYRLGEEFCIKNVRKSGKHYVFDYYGVEKNLKSIKPRLLGEKQLTNVSLALAAAEILNSLDKNKGDACRICWDDNKLYAAVSEVQVPVRLELITAKQYTSSKVFQENFASIITQYQKNKIFTGPDIILDAAHNPEAVANLMKELTFFKQASHHQSKVVFLFGILGDKPVERIIANFHERPDLLIATLPENARALDPERLVQILKKEKNEWQAKEVSMEVERDVTSGMEKGLLAAGENGLVVVFGSFYLTVKVRKLLLDE